MRSLAALLLCTLAIAASAQQSQWAHLGPDGHLVYRSTPTGDHIVDFSYAGYRGGGVALPDAPVAAKLPPTGADDTASIQSALDHLAAGANTPRALLLAPGTFHLSGTLYLAASNLVLRGSGRGKTILILTGDPHSGIDIGLAASNAHHDADDDADNDSTPVKTSPPSPSARTTLIDVYIPSGTRELPVVSAAGFAPGDTILLKRTISPNYLRFMNMDRLVRDGNAEHWVGSSITTERRIAGIHGNTFTLDVPITDDFDPRFGGGSGTTVTAVLAPARIHDSGVESLTLTAPARSIEYHDPHFDAIHITYAEDIWLRDLELIDTTNFVQVEAPAHRVTIDRVDLIEHNPVTSSAKPFGFSLGGTQTLIMRSSAHGDKLFFAATQSRIQGPNVVLDCDFFGDQAIEPHQRWATGFLVDNTRVHGGAINFINRGEMGSGHGWTIGWSVIWNSSADKLTAQNPPGAINWVIGSRGERMRQPMPIKGSRGQNEGPDLPEATFDDFRKPVQPESLYLQQLTDRLGPQAAKHIGF
jgi:hypothetical protein